MNYKKIYNSLVTRAVSRKKLRRTQEGYVYYEKHHILPRCLGGTDDKSNIILLTAEEHWVAHLLLVKMYPGNVSLIYACQAMSMAGGYNQRTTNKLFGWIRRKYADIISSKHKGRVLSDEHKRKLSEINKGLKRPHMTGNNNPMHKEGVKERVLAKREGQLRVQKRDSVVFMFIKVDKSETFVGTRQEFRKYSGLTSVDVYALVSGAQKKSKTWQLLTQTKEIV